jgi:ABC-type multidrug transport system fused ATPase/permease subunit
MSISEPTTASQDSRSKFRKYLVGKLPYLTLMIGGLTFGLLAILPAYLIASAIRYIDNLRFGKKRPLWQMCLPLLTVAAIGASLITGTPIWFQLQLPAAILVGTIAYILFRQRFIRAMEGAMHERYADEPTSAAEIRKFFLIGIILFNIFGLLNLWLALRFSETTWLLFNAITPLVFAAPSLLRYVKIPSDDHEAPARTPAAGRSASSESLTGP